MALLHAKEVVVRYTVGAAESPNRTVTLSARPRPRVLERVRLERGSVLCAGERCRVSFAGYELAK